MDNKRLCFEQTLEIVFAGSAIVRGLETTIAVYARNLGPMPLEDLIIAIHPVSWNLAAQMLSPGRIARLDPGTTAELSLRLRPGGAAGVEETVQVKIEYRISGNRRRPPPQPFVVAVTAPPVEMRAPHPSPDVPKPSLPLYKRRTLETRRAHLIEEFEAANAQLSRALSDVERLRLRRTADDLERQIGEIDAQL